jgi:hypothetical protein
MPMLASSLRTYVFRIVAKRNSELLKITLNQDVVYRVSDPDPDSYPDPHGSALI